MDSSDSEDARVHLWVECPLLDHRFGVPCGACDFALSLSVRVLLLSSVNRALRKADRTPLTEEDGGRVSAFAVSELER